jgi:superoxide dismutase, Cu-Zn family
MAPQLVLDFGAGAHDTRPIGERTDIREVTVSARSRLELPGDTVFPESVGVDPVSGDAYVGSMQDGTLYRLGAAGEVEVWSPGGVDERDSVAGVKVDDQGRLWAAGGYNGTVHVYGLAARSLIARMDVGGRPSCVNDFAFVPGGDAYVTDSFISLLFRAGGSPMSLRPWVDLGEAGIPWAQGLNLNGIVITPGANHLVACQTNLGRFWQIALDTGHVCEVALEGGPLPHCDGLAVWGSRMYVAVNALNRLAIVELADDGSAGRVSAHVHCDEFAFPTAVAVRHGQLLVVNGQLDKMGDKPDLPFTVTVLDIPK